MAIDIETEEIMTLYEAASAIPGREPVSIFTMHRWRLKGFHGVKLECIRLGVDWRTSREALKRFIAAINAKPVEVAKPESKLVQTKRAKAAKARLLEMGVGTK